ncbi:hypothetical protein [Helicobacter cetorum]|uniref:Uncharacterized protein n=1 Tax=Helicobacter cetorum (strain ATCC BAA-429 / MIT 00-7128) TaxID=182217 RepID=I0EMH3_HELC0|nr:hypothetical protein [Helicobacter cetorum]AFI04142.1 hypothetical protein HCW_04365 [Helicobacter cetorum MIT 00-7128]
MQKTPRLNRTCKIKNGAKRMSFVFDKDTIENLKKLAKNNQTNMTIVLEKLIANANNHSFQKMHHLIEQNKELYTRLNATFSNLNQIAYHLNYNRIADKDIVDKVFLKHLLEVLSNNLCDNIQLKILNLKLLKSLSLNNSDKRRYTYRIEYYSKKAKAITNLNQLNQGAEDEKEL